ncbi:MAG: class I SAM-dependent methyltransferase [Pseudomonadales bacterium]|nr:class I SAM-dependent methyltransferase [Pseudomonadales bacterium]
MKRVSSKELTAVLEELESVKAYHRDLIDAIRDEVRELVSRIEEVKSEFEVHRSNVEGKVAENGSKVASVAQQLEDARAEIEGRITELNAIVEDLESRRVELATMVNQEVEKLADQTGSLTSEQEADRKLIEDLRRRTEQIAGNISRTIELLNADFGTIAEREQTMKQMLADLSEQVTENAEKVGVLERRYQQNTAFQTFNRVLHKQHMRTIEERWLKQLGVNETRTSLAYLADRIRMIEHQSVGRLATAIEDAMLRILVSNAPRTKKLQVLEIGTLFGIGLSIIYEGNRGQHDSVEFTVIDPLDGYYGEKELDVLLNVPLSQDTFWRNMRVANVPEENVTLITDMSTSDDAIAQAARKKYDVLIIDADHTYAGVKADFDNYWEMVKRGGFIIFDDYGAEDWPDVKQFVDDEVMGLEQLAFVGAEWRTAVFRVVKKSKTPAKSKKS